jgi:hypothetical protein
MIPLGSQPDEKFSEEAKRMMAGGLGEVELKLVASYTAPLFWVLNDQGKQTFRNGSTFFLDTGARIFAVSAAHVVEECLTASRDPSFAGCMFGSEGQSVSVRLEDRLIARDRDLDMATFTVSEEEVRRVGKVVLRRCWKDWPPPVMQRDRGVLFAGYPGVGRIQIGPRALEFGCISLSGIAQNVSEQNISTLIERDQLVRSFGTDSFPENFKFGGISGGPVIAITETKAIRSWIPVGVIFEGPNTSEDPAEAIAGLEIVWARPIQFIHPDGTLDSRRWTELNVNRRS